MKTRKLLAMLVAVAMIVTMLPVVAFAADASVDSVSAYFVATEYDSAENEITGDIVITVELDAAADEGGQDVPVTVDGEGAGSVIVTEGETTGTLTLEDEVVSPGDELVIAAGGETFTLEIPELLDYSAAGSSVVVNKTAVDTNEAVTFTVRFRDGSSVVRNMPVEFWVMSDRDAEKIDGDSIDPKDGYQVLAMTDNNGRVTFEISSAVAGEATISVWKWEYDAEGSPDDGLLIGEETITFESDLDASNVDIIEVPSEVSAGNKFDIEVEVTDENDYWIENVDVDLYERYRVNDSENWGSWKKVATQVTDKYGVAEFSLRKDKAGEYQYRARANGVYSHGSNAGETVTVEAAAAYEVKAKADEKYVEVEEDATITFNYYDRYGSKLVPEGFEDAEDVEIIDPDGDELDEHDYSATFDGKDLDVVFNPEDEGEWIVRAYIPNSGIYAETKVIVAEFGEAEELGLKLFDASGEDEIEDAVVRIYDKDADTPAPNEYLVKAFEYDGNDIERELDAADDDIYFSSSNVKIATVNSEGEVTLKDDASGVVTITAVHVESGLEASIDIRVAGAPASIAVEAEPAPGALEVEVTLEYLDEDGNRAIESDDNEGYRVVVPDELTVSSQDDFEEGVATFNLEADDFGTYRVTVVTDEGISERFDVTFSEEAAAPEIVKVVLTIGANFGLVDGAVTELDAPAFIEAGRTFVPVRFLAEAFGAEADWSPKDGPVETVTLTTDDMEIVIGIGDEFLTVTKDGEAEVMTFDGAAQIKEGRTYLPFRAIAEAFGAEVDYGTDAEGYVTWVSFE